MTNAEIFQSTFPQGERRRCAHMHQDVQVISIHVPTRGTTIPGSSFIHGDLYFNPRSHKGNDFSTLYQITAQNDFNPRSHKGNDYYFEPRAGHPLISIHVPTRGTTTPVFLIELQEIFQSTFPQGERLL